MKCPNCEADLEVLLTLHNGPYKALNSHKKRGPRPDVALRNKQRAKRRQEALAQKDSIQKAIHAAYHKNSCTCESESNRDQ